MGATAGWLGPAWFASSLLTHAGPFGVMYGLFLRTTDQLFGEAFDLPGYRDRSFWEAAWNIFNPVNMAFDFTLAVLFQGVINKATFGTVNPSQAQITARYPPVVPQSTAKPIHGNSAQSTKPQHGYEIFEVKTGDVVKTGISGQPLR